MKQHSPEESFDERRTCNRFRVQAPAIARIGNREIWAFTRDISTRAVYFRTEEGLPIGEVLDFVIKMPPSVSLANPCFIKGRGRIMRVDSLGGDECGVVVEILESDIEKEVTHEHLDGLP